MEIFNNIDENIKNKLSMLHENYYNSLLYSFTKTRYITIKSREIVISLISSLEPEQTELIDSINLYSNEDKEISSIHRNDIYNILLKWKNIIVEYGNLTHPTIIFFKRNNLLKPEIINIFETVNKSLNNILSFPYPLYAVHRDNKILINGSIPKDNFVKKLREYLIVDDYNLQYIEYKEV